MNLCELINGVVFSVRLQAQVFKWGGVKVKAAQQTADCMSSTAQKVCWISWAISWLLDQLSSFYASNSRRQGCVVLPSDILPPTPTCLHPNSFSRPVELFWAVFIATDPGFVLQLELFAVSLTQERVRAERNALGFKLSTWVLWGAGNRI